MLGTFPKLYNICIDFNLCVRWYLLSLVAYILICRISISARWISMRFPIKYGNARENQSTRAAPLSRFPWWLEFIEYRFNVMTSYVNYLWPVFQPFFEKNYNRFSFIYVYGRTLAAIFSINSFTIKINVSNIDRYMLQFKLKQRQWYQRRWRRWQKSSRQ